MIGGLIKGLIGFFAGGVGHKIGTTLIDGAAILAIGTPIVLWFLGHKDEIAVTLTWSQIFFFGFVLAAVVKVAHYTRAGNPDARNDYQ
jgi:hypothetical protein